MKNDPRALLLASAVGSLFGYGNFAYAQQATPAQNQPEVKAAKPVETVVVTGSRIRRPNLASTVPITSIQGEVLFQQADTSVGDALNSLPQLRSTFAQQNPGAGIGIAGLSLLDLRGLGTARTLVLVNGRRHVPADILSNAVSPDVNSIPNDMIERTDIVTGGNSAVYGSDAIAGVVNFVLRRNYDGFQVRVRGGATEEGNVANQYVSAMYGKNLNDGRGNILLHGEYSQLDRAYASDFKAFRSNNNYVVVDADGGATIVNGGDGVFDNQFFTDIRSSTIHRNGLVPINQRNIPNAGACGNATIANDGPPTTTGPAFNCTYFFDDSGRLVQQTGNRVGTSINPSFIGGNGQTGREGKLISVIPYNERINFNLVGRYEFNPLLEVFVEAKWNRVNAIGNNAGPSFNQGTGGTVDFRERPRLDNPFLNPADRTTLANLILASGCRTDLQVTCPAGGNLTATDIANIGNGSFRFVNSRTLLDVGLRDERFQRDTVRVVGGITGTFNDNWTYELSLNYGEFVQNSVQTGFIDRQRFALAMDAGRNGANGQIQCRSQFDAASAVQLVGFSAPPGANAARLAADIAACVPYNPFGAPDNSASIAYFSRDGQNKAKLTQTILNFFISGDLKGYLELQGGPVRFSFGGEYRQEDAFFQQDQFIADGFTNGVAIPTFKPPTFEVSELFGEVQLPILANLPLAKELTLSAAGRRANYQGTTDVVTAYNVGLDYAPLEDIRFRGNFSRSVRAPNVSETGFPLIPNFSNNFNDPCNPANIGSGVRAANCLAAIGATNLAGLTNALQSLAIVSGSNPNLLAETSDSYTYGLVFTPKILARFNLSIDYYDITVNNVIANITVQTLVNQCYDSPTLANIYCAQFTRWNGPGLGPNGEQPGRILGNSLISAPLNFASRVRRGVDFNASYRHSFGAVEIDTSVVYTHNLQISNYQDPTNPSVETRLLKQLGDPRDEFRWDVDASFKNFGIGYRMRYIGPMDIGLFATTDTINGLPPTNIDQFPVRGFKEIMYHDINVSYDWDVKGGPRLRFTAGIDNVANEGVPNGAGTATGAGSAIYSFGGRSYYAGVRARF